MSFLEVSVLWSFHGHQGCAPVLPSPVPLRRSPRMIHRVRCMRALSRRASVVRAMIARAGLSALFATLAVAGLASAGPKAESFWQVEDVRAGMKGIGKTVIK